MKSTIETLPIDVLYLFVDHLEFQDVKTLSWVNKRLREACLPSLFRRVRFTFSNHGFREMRHLLNSNVCPHIISFTYIVPELVKPEIKEFEPFPTEAYVQDYDVGVLPDTFLPYRLIYDTLRQSCEEQYDILKNGTDTALLSTTFSQLPNLNQLNLCFFNTVEKADWLELYLRFNVFMSQEHHIQVVSNALKVARGHGRFIHTLNLVGLEVSDDWDGVPHTHVLTDYLSEMLRHVHHFRLTGAGASIQLLSSTMLEDLYSLELCSLDISQASLRNFLQTNRSIRSIGFHDVELYEDEDLKTDLSPDILCSMLGTSSVSLKSVGCDDLPHQEKRWRLSVNR